MVENMPSRGKHVLTPKTPQKHQNSIFGVAQPHICILGMVENMPSPPKVASSVRAEGPNQSLTRSGAGGPTDPANWYLLGGEAAQN